MVVATSSGRVSGKMARLFLCLVVSVICVGGFCGKVYAQAGYWKKEVTRDQWGDVKGEVYVQTVRPEAVGGEARDVRNLGIAYFGGNRIVILVGDTEDASSPINGYESGMGTGFNVSLRDGSGNTQNFNGYGISGKEGAFEVRDAGFVQALRKNTKYKLLISYAGTEYVAGTDWYVRADVMGGLSIGSNPPPLAPTSQSPAPSSQRSGGSSNAMEYIKFGNEYLDRGDKNNNKADYDLAIAEFNRAIQLDPNIAAAHFGRGRGYLRKGDNSRAVASYSEALRLNPNDAISYSNRGRAYARMGDYDNAVADFEAAYRIDPKNAIIKQNLEKAKRHEKGL